MGSAEISKKPSVPISAYLQALCSRWVTTEFSDRCLMQNNGEAIRLPLLIEEFFLEE